MLGRQLFLIRQSYNRALKRVSADTKIPVDAIDRIECGIGRFYWYEIAQLLGEKPATVATQLSRGREKLRTHLEQEGFA